MTGDEMERAIEFLLQSQATLEERVTQTQEQLGELNNIIRMQSESQGELNQTLARTLTALVDAQAKTGEKVDRLAGVVEKLVERLSP